MKHQIFKALLAFALILPNAPTAASEAATMPMCDDAQLGVACVTRSETIDQWALEEVAPPVGTQNALRLWTESFLPVTGLFGEEQPALLVLACRENTTSIEVQFGTNFMSGNTGFGTLTYKAGDHPPRSVEMSASKDNSSLGIFSGTQSIPLIVSLFEDERLIVSARAFSGETVTATFAIDGLEEAIEPLRALCNW